MFILHGGMFKFAPRSLQITQQEAPDNCLNFMLHTVSCKRTNQALKFEVE